MVQYKCPKCGAFLESPSSLVGQHEECPFCHANVPVPSAPGSSVSAQEKPTGLSSQTLIVIGVIGVLAVIAVSFSIWFFAIRNPSEREHSATVSGGAWSVKGGGSSDLLRGMKVYLLKADCSGATIRQYYQQAADEAKNAAAFWRKAAKEGREKPDEYGIYKKSADGYDADANSLDEYATAVIADAKRIPDRMDVRDAYRVMRVVADSEPGSKKYSIVMPLGGRFGDVVKECVQRTVQVNIDGKFSFDAVPGGKYYLYAYWSTEISSIEWLIFLDVKESATISQDLFNDTAEIIWNKHV